MKRKALVDEMDEAPVQKKCKTTTWQRYLRKFALTEGMSVFSVANDYLKLV